MYIKYTRKNIYGIWKISEDLSKILPVYFSNNYKLPKVWEDITTRNTVIYDRIDILTESEAFLESI